MGALGAEIEVPGTAGGGSSLLGEAGAWGAAAGEADVVGDAVWEAVVWEAVVWEAVVWEAGVWEVTAALRRVAFVGAIDGRLLAGAGVAAGREAGSCAAAREKAGTASRTPEAIQVRARPDWKHCRRKQQAISEVYRRCCPRLVQGSGDPALTSTTMVGEGG